MTLLDDLAVARGDVKLWCALWLHATDVLVAAAEEHHTEASSLHGAPDHATAYCTCGTRDCATAAILDGWDFPAKKKPGPLPTADRPLYLHPEGLDGQMPELGPDGSLGRMRLAAAMIIAAAILACAFVLWLAVGR